MSFKLDKLKTINNILLFLWIIVLVNIVLAIILMSRANMYIAIGIAVLALIAPHIEMRIDKPK